MTTSEAGVPAGAAWGMRVLTIGRAGRRAPAHLMSRVVGAFPPAVRSATRPHPGRVADRRVS
ncbi:hypothetical protein GCM10027271_35930 [Saccharopolyspora gloriosae]